MEQRLTNPAMLFPETYQAVQALSASTAKAQLPEKTTDLVQLRASQINGCSLCVDMHARMAQKSGETDQRLFAVAAWRDAPWFTPAERAALALTESVTRLADQADPVPDVVWDEAARHYDELQLAALLVQIAAINVWNRLNVPIRQEAGAIPLPSR
jgi:AhpD family alkylhydroperoxidase